MINFSEHTVFNLRKVDDKHLNSNAAAMLVDGEIVIGVYKTIRDQVVFTNKRIIAIDVQNLTGVRQELTSMPYSRIQYYTIQTPGFFEVIPDAELTLFFSNEFTAKFEFKGTNDVLKISKEISRFALK